MLLICDQKKITFSNQTEFPYKNYILNDDGTIQYTEISINDFESAKDFQCNVFLFALD